MQTPNAEPLIELALKAGEAILKVYKRGFEAQYKADDSPVTEADLEADRIIVSGLKAKFPQIFILSEESVSGEPKDCEQFFLVDPLDGTKEFLKRNGEFTVNIAWVVQGRPEAAVVHVPAMDETFKADHRGAFHRKGQGAWQPIACAVADSQPALRVVGSRSHGSEALSQWLSQLNRPHTFEAYGSSLKFCRIAQGLADVYPRFGPTCQWDTAAAQCIVEKAGGSVVDLQGQPLRYGVTRATLNPHFICRGQPLSV